MAFMGREQQQALESAGRLADALARAFRPVDLTQLQIMREGELVKALQDANAKSEQMIREHDQDFGQFMRAYYMPIYDEWSRRETIKALRSVRQNLYGHTGGIAI